MDSAAIHKVLGFDEAFVAAIVAGAKVHTIREGQRWQAGDVAHFCVRARQPDQHEFWPPRPVLLVQHLELTATELRVDGRPLPPAGRLALAQADGFATVAGLRAFFAGKPLPFRGQLVHWTARRYQRGRQRALPVVTCATLLLSGARLASPDFR